MNIAVKTLFLTEFFHDLNHEGHGGIRTLEHPGTQEEPFDIVSPVELNGDMDQFIGGKQSPWYGVGTPVDAIGTIVDAYIGEKYLEKGNTPTVV